jgi:ribA/ribD-fused uncharacterized protein
MNLLFKEQDFHQKYSQYFFFYNGYFSNWHSSNFVDLNSGIHYNCSEQYMMAKKALLFDDQYMAKLIMQSKHPREQKSLGRKVANFNKEQWDLNARQIVYEGCYYKFTQNKDAYNYLLETDGHLLVEASPTDVVWGIGLAEHHPLLSDPKNWKGTNWLGQVLTQLREDLVRCKDFKTQKSF